MNDLVGIWSSCLMLLFVIALANLLWMHFAILRMDRSRHPAIKADTDLPEIMATVIAATRRARAAVRKSVVWGKRGAVRVDHGGRRINKNKTKSSSKPKQHINPP